MMENLVIAKAREETVSFPSVRPCSPEGNSECDLELREKGGSKGDRVGVWG